jgi:hypothetical protein
MVRERFEDADVSQALALVAHLVDCQRAGVEAFVTGREGIIIAEEVEAGAIEADADGPFLGMVWGQAIAVAIL